jgi:hypothetical protein
MVIMNIIKLIFLGVASLSTKWYRQHVKPEGVGKMADDSATKTGQWVMCSNKECRELIDAFELKRNGGKCPHCGETVWETE